MYGGEHLDCGLSSFSADLLQKIEMHEPIETRDWTWSLTGTVKADMFYKKSILKINETNKFVLNK